MSGSIRFARSPRRRVAPSLRSGFSLVEVIVSVVLLSVGVLGAAGAAEVAVRLSSRAALEERAVLAAATVLDSLLALAAPAAGEAAVPGVVLRWSVGPAAGGASVITLDAESSGERWTFAALHAPPPLRPQAPP